MRIFFLFQRIKGTFVSFNGNRKYYKETDPTHLEYFPKGSISQLPYDLPDLLRVLVPPDVLVLFLFLLGSQFEYFTEIKERHAWRLNRKVSKQQTRNQSDMKAGVPLDVEAGQSSSFYSLRIRPSLASDTGSDQSREPPRRAPWSRGTPKTRTDTLLFPRPGPKGDPRTVSSWEETVVLQLVVVATSFTPLVRQPRGVLSSSPTQTRNKRRTGAFYQVQLLVPTAELTGFADGENPCSWLARYVEPKG